MSRSPLRDLLAGVFVVAGLAAVAFLAFRVGEAPFSHKGGLALYATFDEVSGLKPLAPVDIAGVRVGRVTGISLNDDYRARVSMDLNPGLELPVDTSASIITGGLLGDRYISLQLGGEEEILGDGEEIAFTESAVVLERLIGKLVNNLGSSD
ncbi:MAG: outer membrane lipid asymmetry maintenance protein MlaD [Candidatus Binatia bacterium]|nr:outer membrane lipid asymmetry maintenance protein MlaD [Candidatus Binatia bacterium]